MRLYPKPMARVPSLPLHSPKGRSHPSPRYDSKLPKKIEKSSWKVGHLLGIRGWLRTIFFFLVLLVAVGFAAIVIMLISGRGFDDINPANKILEITDQDRDPETTLITKNLLKQNQIDPRISVTLWNDAQQQLTGTTLEEAEQALRQGQVNSALQPLVKKLADDFDTGQAAAFTIWVLDDEQQKGASVDLQLNGALLGRFAIEPNRYAITLVQRTGTTSRLQITGVGETRGGAVFRAETATSETETRHLHTARFDSWQLIVK